MQISEIKSFGLLHAQAQEIPVRRYHALCADIVDDGEGPGSWVAQWSNAAAQFAAAGRDLDACRYYNLARFPYPDSPAKQAALRKCVDAFTRWALAQRDLEPLTVDTPQGPVRCWAAGLSADRPRPLVLAMGGIVSIKEQWAPLLTKLPALGLAGLVAEMPGVGENAQQYTAESWKTVSALLDAVADRADAERTFALALSFSGHLALRCAVNDPRIRGIATVGAPVRHLFTDPAAYRAMPQITRATLTHLTGLDESELVDSLPAWALSDDELRALDIPVYYVASRRDEIIPAADPRLLAESVRGADVLEFDDVHGAPNHAALLRMWIIRSMLSTQGTNARVLRIANTALAVLRAREAVGGFLSSLPPRGIRRG
jgi:pimeloyl-ACP methyl ester carboxylesterase